MNSLKIIIGLLLFTFQCFAQNTDSRLEGLETEIEHLMDAYSTVGLSVAIVENGKVIYTNGFGYRDLKNQLPVNTNTQFAIGSVTKQFTASLMGVYQGQGKLTLQDKPSQHIKGLKFYNDEMDNLITIEDLMAHRSGIGSVDGTQVFFPLNDLDQHMARLPYLKPNSKVRERFDYSNMGYSILGSIGEKVSGKTWSENLQENIFSPLEMNNTTTTLADFESADEFSLGYTVSENKPIQAIFEDQRENNPGGGMSSDVNDLSNWMMMLLNKGQFNGKEVLPQSFIEESFNGHESLSNQFKFDEKNDIQFNMYGYGWAVHMYKNKYRVHHTGNTSGYTAHVELFPYENVGIVVLSNQHASRVVNDISDIIGDRMLGLERKAWNEYEVQVRRARTFPSSIPGINQEEKPTHSLEDFCGKYMHKGYGEIEVSIKDGNLSAALTEVEFALEHDAGNNFWNVSMKEVHQNYPEFQWRFLTNDKGAISSLTIHLQREAVAFVKVNKENQ